MKEYTVDVKESVTRRIKVSADSAIKAKKKAIEQYQEWNIMQYLVDVPETVERTVLVSIRGER